MDPLTREITIEKCPLCGSKEIHTLEYEQDFIVGFQVDITKSTGEQFTLYLTCPTKNEPFKIVISMPKDVKWVREKKN